ncbi:uncharacterized protein MONBRDRAFT_35379 [Monosiga brevicollis MX1]|uniref:ubiquitinyl hydrolase 1 n=1 Tax=Monosiga brevicollis TaxID=81824 RepID=A9UNN1_MONBE|nr:uncharacterized protein MONBRDRAFT_35379 [Monosiga brevicollis MX1]EDQ92270.1 predicted protein [Monosiga brevicollis MX1]|eukprot:XP_001742032.1 hypothetical protein [Monosiga brevicollis MX1]
MAEEDPIVSPAAIAWEYVLGCNQGDAKVQARDTANACVLALQAFLEASAKPGAFVNAHPQWEAFVAAVQVLAQHVEQSTVAAADEAGDSDASDSGVSGDDSDDDEGIMAKGLVTRPTCLYLHLKYGCALVATTGPDGRVSLFVLGLDNQHFVAQAPPNSQVETTARTDGHFLLPVGSLWSQSDVQNVIKLAKQSLKRSANAEDGKVHKTPGFVHQAYTRAWSEHVNGNASSNLLTTDQWHAAAQRHMVALNNLGARVRHHNNAQLDAMYSQLLQATSNMVRQFDQTRGSPAARQLELSWDNFRAADVPRTAPNSVVSTVASVVNEYNAALNTPKRSQGLDIHAICNDLGASLSLSPEIQTALANQRLTLAHLKQLSLTLDKLQAKVVFKLVFERYVHQTLTRIHACDRAFDAEAIALDDELLLHLLDMHSKVCTELGGSSPDPAETTTSELYTELLPLPAALQSQKALMQVAALVFLRYAAECTWPQLPWSSPEYSMPNLEPIVPFWTLDDAQDMHTMNMALCFISERHPTDEIPFLVASTLGTLQDDFAQHYSNWKQDTWYSTSLEERLQQERQNHRRLRQEHWQTVQRKQRNAKQYAADLENLEQSRDVAQKEQYTASHDADAARRECQLHVKGCHFAREYLGQRGHSNWSIYSHGISWYTCSTCSNLKSKYTSKDSTRSQAEKNTTSAQAQVDAKSKQLRAELVPPPAVQLSLPESDHEALATLTVFYLPLRLQRLAECARQTFTLMQEVDEPRKKQQSKRHTEAFQLFNNLQTGSQAKLDIDIDLQATTLEPRTNTRFVSVHHLQGEEDDINYMERPLLSTLAQWKPPKDRTELAAFFGTVSPTGPAPKPSRRRQPQAVDRLGAFRHQAVNPSIEPSDAKATHQWSDRGTEGKATPFAVSSCANLDDGDIFAAQRAGRLLQWTNLAGILRLDALSLLEPQVVRLLKAMVAEVGDLEDHFQRAVAWPSRDPAVWRTLLAAIRRSIVNMSTACKFVPYGAALGTLTGILTAFDAPSQSQDAMSDNSPTAFDLVLQLTECLDAHAQNWATEQSKALAAGNEALVNHLQQRRFEAYNLAIVAFRHVSWTKVEVRQRRQALRQLLRYRILGGGHGDGSNSSMWLNDAALTSMSRLLVELCQELQSSVEEPDFPTRMAQWVDEAMGHAGGASQAQSAQLYGDTLNLLVIDSGRLAINCLTGFVLFNGQPASQLPPRLLEDAEYKSFFGTRMFPVAVDKDGKTYRAVAPIDGFMYTFIDTDGAADGHQLSIIQEPEPKPDDPAGGPRPGQRLLLARGLARALLSEHPLHSQMVAWLDLVSESIVLRQLPERDSCGFQARHVAYVGVSIADDWQLLRPPPNMQEQAVVDMLPIATHVACHLAEADVEESESGWQSWIWAETVREHPVLMALHDVLLRVEDACSLSWYRPCSNASCVDVDLLRLGLRFELSPEEGIRSLNHQGYRLCALQVLKDKLPGFDSYLLLERTVQFESEAGRLPAARHRLLVPEPLEASQTPEHALASRRSFTANIHDTLGYLEAQSTTDRLALALVYCRLKPEQVDLCAGRNGPAQSLELVRQCWQGHHFTVLEQDYLEAVAHETRFPSLALAVAVIARASLSWKDEDDQKQQRMLALAQPQPLDLAYYQQHHRGLPLGLRLTPHEMRELGLPELEGSIAPFCDVGDWNLPEDALRGHVSRKVTQGAAQLHQDLASACDELASFERSIATREQDLCRLVEQQEQRPETTDPALALDIERKDGTRMYQHLQRELSKSMALHDRRAQVRFTLPDDPTLLEGELATLTQLTAERQCLWQHLARALTLPTTVHQALNDPLRARMSMLQVGGLLRRATPQSLLYVLAGVNDDERLRRVREHNPYFDQSHWPNFQIVAIEWLQRIVLEQRLDRITRLARALRHVDGPAQNNIKEVMLREVMTVRTYAAVEHLEWLLFEVSSQIQIRPKQTAVALRLIKAEVDEKKGPVLQLNMGEGKTRVILPMLLLFYRAQRASATGTGMLPLTFFLPQLVDQSYEALHAKLTASPFKMPLHHFRFDRSVNATQAWISRASARLCWLEGQGHGAVVLTPSDWLSLRLKVVELRDAQRPLLARLLNCRVVEACPFLHLYDEVDEILKYNFQLIYAAGGRERLVHREARVLAVQAVLQLLHTPDAAMQEAMDKGDGTSWLANEAHEASGEALFVPKFVIDQSAAKRKWRALCDAMMARLLQRPELGELSWLTEFADGQAQKLACFTCDPTSSLDSLRVKLSEGHTALLCTLRGLLAHKMLLRILSRRVNVNYGIDERRDKQIAVPYQATDTPTERSEFASMDDQLVMTHLAWYVKGLRPTDMENAVIQLQRRSEQQQASLYQEWCDAAGGSSKLPDEVPREANALDLQDENQAALLHATFGHNYKCINFWLTTVVLPRTCQYPARLQATPFHLADASHQMGFSGTNDTNLTLPLSICSVPDLNKVEVQVMPRITDEHSIDTELGATNGLMVRALQTEMFVDCIQELIVHDDIQHPESRPLPELVLDKALHMGVEALIDVGALLAGKPLHACAKYLLSHKHLNSKITWEHVVYSAKDQASQRQQWVVQDRHGHVDPLRLATVDPAHAMVIYDQYNCRGADLALKQEARALMTLGLSVCKDELMQAAGRLRQLTRGQKLAVAAPSFVISAMQRVLGRPSSDNAKLGVGEMIKFVLLNTQSRNLGGLKLQAQQGLQFGYSRADQRMFRLREQNEPTELFGGVYNERTTIEEAKYQNKLLRHQADKEVDEQLQTHIHAIFERCKEFGITRKDVERGQGELRSEDLEIEREEEQELEEEQQREVQRKATLARPEEKWPVDSLLSQEFDKCQARGKLKLLQDCQPLADLGFQWPPEKQIWCTSNWYQWSADEEHTTRLPLVSCCIVLNDRVVVVTEREASWFLENKGLAPYQRAPHAYAHELGTPALVQLRCTANARLEELLTTGVLAMFLLINCQVYLAAKDVAGEVVRPAENASYRKRIEQAWRCIFKPLGQRAVEVAEKVVELRDARHLLPRSHLKDQCVAVATVAFAR